MSRALRVEGCPDEEPRPLLEAATLRDDGEGGAAMHRRQRLAASSTARFRPARLAASCQVGPVDQRGRHVARA